MSREELLVQVLSLSREDRAQVAAELLASLEEPNEDAVAAAWAPELERRSRELAEGRVEPIDWETARVELLRDLEGRRANRAAR